MLLAAFTLSQILSYSFPSAPVRDAGGNAIAYTLDTQGVRTVWFARGPQFAPKMVWSSGADDGQELSNLAISNDNRYVVYVRGSDHDENWPVPLQPNPASYTVEQQEQVWAVSTDGGTPKLIGNGDAPAISPDSMRVVFVDGAGAVEVAPIDGSAPAKKLFFDRGKDSDLRWSPDGSALAFVSSRDGDHSFIGIYRNGATSLEFLAPTTSQDFMPRWSFNGKAIAFVRTPGAGGPPQNPLDWNPQPWQIWVAQPGTANARQLWASGSTQRDSLPQSGLGPFLEWLSGNRLVFNSERDNWPRLYVLEAQPRGAVEFAANTRQFVAQPLTQPGVMVENASVAPDGTSVVYAANTGSTPGDDDRRHLYRIERFENMDVKLTSGASSEFYPVALAGGAVAYSAATAQQPLLVTLLADGSRRALNALPADYPSSQLVTPREVSFLAPDGLKIYGQLFEPAGGGKHPGIIFVHGGPVRQMLLTWHYMDYYSNAYAVNQYLASRGFAVLSVNYRTGIGYGHDFNFPPKWGPTGASEYQDVVAGAKFLQRQSNVDPNRIGIWGGSYGGYLAALALARNSNIFKAGVDFHGVHDWSLDIDNPVWGITNQFKRYQQFDTRAMMKLAWESSPDSAIATWRSPVLLIQGDDDRNVEFHQMVDLVERLRAARVPFEQIVIPNEIHGFLRYASWAMADEATLDYFERQLK
jgi:dipeptidyl aminopeptidase/acylaminoacyl peptidase